MNLVRGLLLLLLLFCAALLECKQLLGAEGLVVDLCGRLDEVLEVCPVRHICLAQSK